MALAMKATVTTMSSNPWVRSRWTTCSIIGRLAMGSMGLGWFEVSGRSRVPSPPAMMTAFIGSPSEPAGVAGAAGPRPSARACRATGMYEPAAIQARTRPMIPVTQAKTWNGCLPLGRAVAQQERRVREHESERTRLSHPQHVYALGAPSEARAKTATRHHHLAGHGRHPEPHRDGAVDDDGDDRGADQDPVGHRVEDLAQRGDLMEPTGHVAVDPVGRAEHAEQYGGRRLAVGAEEQPQEEGDAGQPDHRDQVGNGEDPVEVLILARRRRTGRQRHRASGRLRHGF